jgi:hypothetical protein
MTSKRKNRKSKSACETRGARKQMTLLMNGFTTDKTAAAREASPDEGSFAGRYPIEISTILPMSTNISSAAMNPFIVQKSPSGYEKVVDSHMRASGVQPSLYPDSFGPKSSGKHLCSLQEQLPVLTML